MVPSSQSQTEKELRLSSPLIELFALPKMIEYAHSDTYVHSIKIILIAGLLFTAMLRVMPLFPNLTLRLQEPNAIQSNSLCAVSQVRRHHPHDGPLPPLPKFLTPRSLAQWLYEDHLDDITIHPKGQTPCISPRSQPPAPEKYASDDSATESESESVMIKFIAERKKRKAQRALFAIDVVPPSDATG